MFKSIFTVILVLFVKLALAQPYKTIKPSAPYKWMLGLSWTAVDDDGRPFTNIFDVGQGWSITPFPSRFSVDRFLKKGLSVEAVATYSMLNGSRYVNGIKGAPGNMIAVDLHAKYAFYYLYAPKAKWFDPYVTLGAGYTYRTSDPKIAHSPSLNFGIGFNFWIVKSFGIQLGSTAKFGFLPKFWRTSSNYFVHTAGVVYRFDTSKRKKNDFGNKKHKWTRQRKGYKQKGGH